MKAKVVFTVFLILGLSGALSSCVISVSDGNIASEERSAAGFDGIELAGTADVYVHPADDYKVVVTTNSDLQHKVITEVIGTHLRIDEKPFLVSRKGVTVDVYMPARKSIHLINSGVGDIDAQNYQVENARVEISGVGDIKIWATRRLTGKISGVGDIRYKGGPSVDIDRDGVGNVKKL